jgi:hypothetical protein
MHTRTNPKKKITNPKKKKIKKNKKKKAPRSHTTLVKVVGACVASKVEQASPPIQLQASHAHTHVHAHAHKPKKKKNKVCKRGAFEYANGGLLK